MQPILQYPNDLRLVVLCGGVVGPLTVLEQQNVSQDSVQAVFRIIGESHWISIYQHGVLLMHEILSCSDEPYPHATHVHAFTDVLPHFYRGSQYSISVQFTSLKEVQPEQSKMVVLFPNPLGHGPVPYTSIDWDFNSTGLTWNTTHFYTLPQGNVAVQTQSHLDLALSSSTACTSERTTHEDTLALV